MICRWWNGCRVGWIVRLLIVGLVVLLLLVRRGAFEKRHDSKFVENQMSATFQIKGFGFEKLVRNIWLQRRLCSCSISTASSTSSTTNTNRTMSLIAMSRIPREQFYQRSIRSNLGGHED